MKREQAIDLILSSGLTEQADQLIGALCPSSRLIVNDSPPTPAGGRHASHFGGLPSMPPGTPWPRWDKHDYLNHEIARLKKSMQRDPRDKRVRDRIARMQRQLSDGPVLLAFHAQISLNELNAVAPLPDWPRDGSLLFFYDTGQDDGLEPIARGHCRVLFFGAERELARTDAPPDLHVSEICPERGLTITQEWTLPHLADPEGLEDSSWECEYGALLRQLMPPDGNQCRIFHRCGGHAQYNFALGNMRLDCELIANDIRAGTSVHDDGRLAGFETAASEWQLLLQIDSDEKLIWNWGAEGRVFYWIRLQDLRALDFEHVWGMLKCHWAL